MSRLIIKSVFLVFIFPGLGWMAFHRLEQQGFFNLQELNFEFDSQQEANEAYLAPLKKEAEEKIEALKGQALSKLDLKAIYAKLNNLEWINQVYITREWPSSLHIRIVPHPAKLLFYTAQGEIVPILENGHLLKPIAANVAPDLTVAEGNEFLKNKELRKRGIELVEKLPSKGALEKSKISKIIYDNKEGFGLELIRSGIQVRLGQNNFDLKTARVTQVLNYLETNKIDARVIDANLSQKVLVRSRKAP